MTKKAYGQVLVEELQEKAEKGAEKTGFDMGEVEHIDDFWELKELFKHLQEVQGDYHMRLNFETSKEGEPSFRIDGINAQGNWRISESAHRELKITPNGTVTVATINTWVFDYWYVKVDSMGWIDIFLSDADMIGDSGTFDGDVIHIVMFPKK